MTVGYPVVDPSRLVVVKPGESYECDVPVPAQFRAEPHVDLAVQRMYVQGPAPAPVLAFAATPLF